MTIYGYAQVSEDGQTLDCQDAVLKAAGCQIIYSEKTSDAKSHRSQLAKLLEAVGDGDTVIITRLGRLARSTRDLLNTLDSISKAKAPFKSLADGWADTTALPQGLLLLTVLGGLDELERELIKVGASEGRAPAKAAIMGRPPKLTPHQRQQALKRREAGEPLSAIARTYGVAHTTIARL
jgi:DNA invertase Pin-like site-specific DNA recombinase